jgi:hypothetical protein
MERIGLDGEKGMERKREVSCAKLSEAKDVKQATREEGRVMGGW